MFVQKLEPTWVRTALLSRQKSTRLAVQKHWHGCMSSSCWLTVFVQMWKHKTRQMTPSQNSGCPKVGPLCHGTTWIAALITIFTIKMVITFAFLCRPVGLALRSFQLPFSVSVPVLHEPFSLTLKTQQGLPLKLMGTTGLPPDGRCLRGIYSRILPVNSTKII